MESLAKLIHRMIVLLCVGLFLAGAAWNLSHPQDVDAQDTAQQDMSQETTDVLFTPEITQNLQEHENDIALDSRIAALRMQRDTSWQQLYHTVEQLDFAEKQQTLQQYAELQYQEQRLELLLSAKSVEQCLVLLTSEQANIIVPETILQKEYEKLYDLILRNTTYDETQIILVPLK